MKFQFVVQTLLDIRCGILWDVSICYFVWSGLFVKFQFVVETQLLFE